ERLSLSAGEPWHQRQSGGGRGDDDDQRADFVASGHTRGDGCLGQYAARNPRLPAVASGEGGSVRHRPRRASCTGCAKTHVLLAAAWLSRRGDAVSVIGSALLAKAAGAGHRQIAALLGRPACTVRGWLRRFGGGAEGGRGV